MPLQMERTERKKREPIMPFAKYFKPKDQQQTMSNASGSAAPIGKETGANRAAPPAHKPTPKRKTIGQRMAESRGY